MNMTIRKLTVLACLGAFIFGIAACNTVHGVGKDTERAGEKIQQEADEHKDSDDR